MNIRDIEAAPTVLQANTENANAAQQIQTERQEQAGQRRDEFIMSMREGRDEYRDERDQYIRSMNVVQNALYSVSNVTRNKLGLLNQMRNRSLNDPGTTQKLVDIDLSGGIKNLKVYKMEE